AGVAFVPTAFGWVLQGAPGGRSLRHMYTNCSYMTTSPQTPATSSEWVNSSQVKCICQNPSQPFIEPLTNPDSKQTIANWNSKFTSTIRHNPKNKRYFTPIPWFNKERPEPNYHAAQVQCRI